MKNIYLITGGSGFIGSFLASKIIKDNDSEVFILDIIAPPNYLSKKIIFRKIDILDLSKLKKFISKIQPNYIFHLAARTDLNGKKIKDYEINFQGVENIITACNEISSVKRIVFASSMLVCKLGYVPKNNQDYSPPNYYGLSKVIAEKIIRNSNLKFNWCIVRPTSIWGPGFKVPYSKFFELILKGQYFHIGNSIVYKTYGYIENTCFQLYSIMKSPKSKIQSKLFYLGDSNEYIIKDWAIEIANASGSKKIKTIPRFLVLGISSLGSFLKLFNIRFPLTIFRYKNMTTTNQVDLSEINNLAPNLPYTRIEGVKSTIKWIRKES